MTSLDPMITADLGALGEDSRRNLVGLDDALRTTNMYRDDRPGAEARRDALADERRRELAMMPLTLAHVFAHRVGRAAAGVAGLVCAAVLVVMIAEPMLFQFAAWLVPGIDLGMLAALAALAIVATYVVATWLAESWFALRMRSALVTGDDPYRDLDALARGPVEIAHQAVRRVDGLALGLFLAGITAVAVAFGYLVAIVTALHAYPYSWSMDVLPYSGALGRNLDVLVNALIGVCLFAFVLARACKRDVAPGLGRQPAILRLHGHPLGLAFAVVVGLATSYAAFHSLRMYDFRNALPTTDMKYLLGFGAMIAIVGVAAWALLWLRRREIARLGE